MTHFMKCHFHASRAKDPKFRHVSPPNQQTLTSCPPPSWTQPSPPSGLHSTPASPSPTNHLHNSDRTDQSITFRIAHSSYRILESALLLASLVSGIHGLLLLFRRKWGNWRKRICVWGSRDGDGISCLSTGDVTCLVDWTYTL